MKKSKELIHSRIFIAALAFVLSFTMLLAGCANSGGSDSSEEKASQVQETETKENSASGASAEEKDASDSHSTTGKAESGEKSSASGSSQTGSASGSVSRTPAGALHVKGTHLMDSKGNIVQLRGVSTHGIAWFPDYINEKCFKQLHDKWKVNTIRLAMYTAEYGGYCSGGDKAALKSLIDKGVSCATAQGMYVIIDWHILSDGNPNSHLSEAKAFFKEMSAKYASHNNVIYEICNEPNGGTSWKDIKSYADKIIPVIRKNDSDAVILVGTPNWSQYVDQAAADPIKGYDNIMYTLHFYAATHTDSLRNTLAAAVESGLPVFVSEFGICDASGSGAINEAQANKWISLLNKYGISYVAWNLSNKAETSALIKSSCTKTSGFTSSDLSDSGKWLYKTLTGSSAASDSAKSSSSKSSSSKTSSSSTTPPAGSAGSSQSGGQSGSQSGSQSSATANATLTYTANLVNSWESGGSTFYQYDLTVRNKTGKPCKNWNVKLNFSGPVTLTDGWNGNYKASGSSITITSKDYNGELAAGQTTGNVGFIVKGAAGLKLK